jgi:RHS repeat-associated protein
MAGLSAFAQNNPNEEQGLKPYDSFHGGDLDSVSLTNGGLVLHLPLASFPQRGNLDLSFMVRFSSKQWYVHTHCTNNPRGGQNCTYNWAPMGISGVQVVSSVDWWMQGTHSADGSGFDWTRGVTSPDGNTHQFGGDDGGETLGPTYPLRSLDATGLLQPDMHTLILPNGTVYSYPNFSDGTITGPPPSVAKEGVQPSTVTDANGNQITIAANGWTDTLGRLIPGQSPATGFPVQPGVPTSDLSKCPAGTATAWVWNVPGVAGVNGGVRTFYFCYSLVSISTNFQAGGISEYSSSNTSVLSAVVLPDLTKWTFSYNNYGDVAQFSFPTGGSISYGYAAGPLLVTVGTPASRWVTSRTVDANDGTGGHQWTYQYSGQVTNPPTGSIYSGQAIVTSPAPDSNDTVHTITSPVPGSYESVFDTQVQYYQGHVSGGTLLKTVTSQYTGVQNSRGTDLTQAMNVVLTQATTTFPGGQSSRAVNTYDSGNTVTQVYLNGPPVTFPVVFGSVLQHDEYDFSNTLVRSTFNHYLWQDNSTYKTSNFISLPVYSMARNAAGCELSKTSFGHDETNNDSNGNPVTLQPSGISTQHVAAPGAVRGNRTSASKWLISGCAEQSAITSHTIPYDTGVPYQTFDPLGRFTQFTYSSAFAGAYLTQTNMPDTGSPVVHHVISGNYDFNTGLLTTFTDENSQNFTYTYDDMLRLTQGNHPDGGITKFLYPNVTTVERQRLITGSTYDDYKVLFDGLGRPIQTQQTIPGQTILTDTTYDVVGRVASASNPYFQGSNHLTDPTYGLTQYQYDGLSRPTRTTKQDQSFTTVTYSDNCTTATDESGKARKACADAFGRMVTVFEDPSGLNYETDYQYDPLNNLTRVDQKGSAPSDSSQWRTRTFFYDSLSRLLTANNPESGAITYSYDADSNMTSKTDARGISTTYSFDALNRVTAKTFSDGTPTASYSYDVGCCAVNPLHGIGRLTYEFTGNTGMVYVYDSMGRISTQFDCPPSYIQRGGCYWTNAAYDLTGNLTNLAYPDGRLVTYNYNSAGWLNQVQFANFNGTAVGYNYWSVSDSNFLASGAPSLVTLGSGDVESQAFNPRLQLSQKTVTGNGLGTLANHVFSYGTQNNGNVMSVTDQLSSAYTQTFTYDSLNRLATANESRWGMSYGYDAWGNYLQQNQTGGSTFAHSYLAAPNNRLIGYTYDPAGNMLNDGFHQYVYDAENRIKTVDSTGATYTYNPEGNRVRKDKGSNSTEYFFFGGNVIAELDQAGNYTDYIYAGGKRVAKADAFFRELEIGGSNSTNNQASTFAFSKAGGLAGRVIRSGDKLYLWQYEWSGTEAGMSVTFTDGSSTSWAATDQYGDFLNRQTATGVGRTRIVDLSGFAGKQVSALHLVSEVGTAAGNWGASFHDIALVSTDGSVVSIYNGDPANPTSFDWASGGTGQTSQVGLFPGRYDPNLSTAYYHEDQINSSRMMTGHGGWPVWQATFLPYGEEYNPQGTTNHFKFTGKERDSESQLDYFGARYYSSGLGRWISADWSPVPVPVPYADFSDPQSLNLYSYVRGLPTSRIDADGHDGGAAAATWELVTGGAEGAEVSGGFWAAGSVGLPGLLGGGLAYVAINSTAENNNTVANAQMQDVIASNKLIMAQQAALSQDAQAGALIKSGTDANKAAAAAIAAAIEGKKAEIYKDTNDVQAHIDKLNEGMKDVARKIEAVKNAVGQKARAAAKELLRKAIKEVKGHEKDLQQKPKIKNKKEEK